MDATAEEAHTKTRRVAVVEAPGEAVDEAQGEAVDEVQGEAAISAKELPATGARAHTTTRRRVSHILHITLPSCIRT